MPNNRAITMEELLDALWILKQWQTVGEPNDPQIVRLVELVASAREKLGD